MADSLTTTCPECQSKIRLKQRPNSGARLKCPKCQSMFRYEDEPEDYDDVVKPAPQRPRSRPGSKPNKKRSRTSSSNISLIAMGGTALVVVALAALLFWFIPRGESQSPIDQELIAVTHEAKQLLDGVADVAGADAAVAKVDLLSSRVEALVVRVGKLPPVPPELARQSQSTYAAQIQQGIESQTAAWRALREQKRSSAKLDGSVSQLIGSETNYFSANMARQKPKPSAGSPSTGVSENAASPLLAAGTNSSVPTKSAIPLKTPFRIGSLAIRVPQGFLLRLPDCRQANGELLSSKWWRWDSDIFNSHRDTISVVRRTNAELGVVDGANNAIPKAIEAAIASLRFAGTPQLTPVTNVVGNGLSLSRVTAIGATVIDTDSVGGTMTGKTAWHVIYVLPGRKPSELVTTVIGVAPPDDADRQLAIEQAILTLSPVETVSIPDAPKAVPLLVKPIDNLLGDEVNGVLLTVRPPKSLFLEFGGGSPKDAGFQWSTAKKFDINSGKFTISATPQSHLPDRASRWQCLLENGDGSSFGRKIQGEPVSDVVLINDVDFYRMSARYIQPGANGNPDTTRHFVVWFAETDTISINIYADTLADQSDEFMKACESAVFSLKLRPTP